MTRRMSGEVLAWWRGWLSPIFHASLRHVHDTVYRCGVMGVEVVLPKTHQYNQPVLFLIVPRFNVAKTIQSSQISFSYRIHVLPDTVAPPSNAPQLRDINELEAFLQSLNLKFLHSDFKNAFATTFQPPIPLPVPTTFVGTAVMDELPVGKTDARSDIYALAATLYHLLYNDDPRFHPFQFPKLSSSNSAINTVLKKALDPDPAKRFQSAREFGDALRRC